MLQRACLEYENTVAGILLNVKIRSPKIYHCEYVHVGTAKVSKDSATFTAGVGQNRMEVISPSHR